MPLIRMQFEVDFNFVCLRFLNEWEGADETVLILHASAHNPTGIDMTKDQWRQLKKVCVERGYLPFFDCAYQVSVSSHFFWIVLQNLRNLPEATRIEQNQERSRDKYELKPRISSIFLPLSRVLPLETWTPTLGAFAISPPPLRKTACPPSRSSSPSRLGRAWGSMEKGSGS